MIERWLPLRGYPRYKISSRGRILDLRMDKILDHFVHVNGYVYVYLYFQNIRCGELLHRLVASTFYDVEDTPNYAVIHKNGDKNDNFVGNLSVIALRDDGNKRMVRGSSPAPVRIQNVDTGEVYGSIREASRALGYISMMHIPEDAKRSGKIFKCRGIRLKVVK